jgi:hypothetical protein
LKPILAVVLSLLPTLAGPGAAYGQIHPTEAPGDPSPLPCTVSGTVVKLAGSVPLKSATVRLENLDHRVQERTFSAVTDGSGHFEVTGIVPGLYMLRVVRNGFVTVFYGQHSSNDPGSLLNLSAGQTMKDLLFRLMPSAVITGHIQNEEGEPLPWVRVSALRATYWRGKRRLTNETAVITDDHGEYRLFGLRPGRYYINATYRPGQHLDPAQQDPSQDQAPPGKLGYVPTFYPGSLDPARAISISVKSGEEIPSADFALEPTTVYSVRGHVRVLGARGAFEEIALSLESRDAIVGWTNTSRQTLSEKGDGSFAIPDVLPGSYTLVASWVDSSGRYQARQSVEVTNNDADGIQLVLTPGMNVSGQIIWDPKPTGLPPPVQVLLRGADTPSAFGSDARVNSNGTFLLQNVSEGVFQLLTYGMSRDHYLKSLRVGGTEVPGDEINLIRGTPNALEITISSRGAHVQGSVVDEDSLPAVGVWVVLVPDAKRRSEARLFKQGVTDQAGRFDLRGIVPGDYTLFSWEHVEMNAWQDPDFLKDFEGKGQSLSLQEGDGKSLQLTAIRAATQDQEQ